MTFQRSYSKVWWGSSNEYSYPTLPMGAATKAAGSQHHSLERIQPWSHLADAAHSHSMGYFATNLPQSHLRSQWTYHSLDLNHCKHSDIGNLSRIQEAEDEHSNELSPLSSSWSSAKRVSPGSMRSQDSGFSDNEETRSHCGLATNNANPAAIASSPVSRGSPTSHKSVRSLKLDSPVSLSSIPSVETPPTVIKRPPQTDVNYTPLVSVSRRISFTSTPNRNVTESPSSKSEGVSVKSKSHKLKEKWSAVAKSLLSPGNNNNNSYHDTNDNEKNASSSPGKKSRSPNKPKDTHQGSKDNTSAISVCEQDKYKYCEEPREEASILDVDNDSISAAPTEAATNYNNETVYLGASSPTPSQCLLQCNRNLSECNDSGTKLVTNTYENPLLNGHSPSLQHWLDDISEDYEHEVLSILQSKSITQIALNNYKITTHLVSKLVRQLQYQSMDVQRSFERVEKTLIENEKLPTAVALHQVLPSMRNLLDLSDDFLQILQRRVVFFAESRANRRRYQDNLDQIRIVLKDTRYSLDRQHYMGMASLLDDVRVLKRNLLIAVRAIYERLLSVLVQAVEERGQSNNLILRANINMIATLMNIDFDGFASLTDAFVRTEVVRTLLLICLDHSVSSVRAMSLRALANVCCTPELITQLDSCGGLEILRDIFHVERRDSNGSSGGPPKRSLLERKEAVSLLTQITANWHSGGQHRIPSLRDNSDGLVDGLSALLTDCDCPQTLLLCAAALNNMSRMEMVAHYSIMAHETIALLIGTMEKLQSAAQSDKILIFIQEQIVGLLWNMSQNKRCHGHLANATVIRFMAVTYQSQFYAIYESRSETEAQKRTIKSILHTLTRLLQDTIMAKDLLEQHLQMHTTPPTTPTTPGTASTSSTSSTPNSFVKSEKGEKLVNSSIRTNSPGRDITLLVRQLLLSPKSECEPQRRYSSKAISNSPANSAATVEKLRMRATRQESYV